MANRDFMLELNGELSLGHSQMLGLGHSHNMTIGGQSDDGLGLRNMADHTGLDMGKGQENEFDLRHARDVKPSTGQLRGNEAPLQQAHDEIHDHENGFIYEDHNGIDIGGDENVEHEDGHDQEDHGLELVVQNHEMGYSGNHELEIVGNHDLDGNLELALDHNQEVGMVPIPGMGSPQNQLVMSTPILQSRSSALAVNHELKVGQEFPDVQSCRRHLRNTAIALHFEIQTVKSDKNRFTAKCASEGCPWRIHCAKLPGVPTFTIRTIHEEHTCGGITHLGHQQASVDWVANSVERRLKENPNCKPKEILEEIHRVYGITLSYKQAWRGKERIMAAMRGSFEEDYRLLPKYCEQILRTNPGSIALVYANHADNSFQRLFVSYQASIYGFVNACRPIIGLDRTVLKSKYLGTLLLASGFDGDGGLFPLAFGVVDEESDDNWLWFLSEVRNLLEINTENMPKLTILSDRQKGIVDGVELNFPTAFHGYCMHYLSESFRKEFNNNVLVNLFWEAAQALTMVDFETKILEIEEMSQDAAYWIRNIPFRLWATAHFEGTRYGHLTANVAESMNTWITEASGLPIVQMMECIRRQLMTWFNERRETSMLWTGALVPSAERYVTDAVDSAHSFQVIRANEAEFEVISHGSSNTVNIRNRCCVCHGWQLYGLPCAHAVAALLSCRQNVQRFAEGCFTVSSYRKAYSQTIHPIPDRTLWAEMSQGYYVEGGDEKGEDVIINPPKSLRPPARPRKRRSRGEDQGRAKRVVHCSRCNQTGHFRTTCSAPI
ncbi:hypothetical protein QQ045_022217 [Rhodiola kirilowii]